MITGHKTMNRTRFSFFILLLLCLFIASIPVAACAKDETFHNAPVKAVFSPRGGCTEAIVKEINDARSDIFVQAYSFTSAPIAQALLNAHKRGVRVEAVLDKSQRREKYTSATFLANAGVPIYIDDKHAIAHNKILIIDGEIIVTGSFNFTKAAEEKNAENLLVIRSGELAEIYRKNWQAHREHSVSYARPEPKERHSGGNVRADLLRPGGW
jgi:phosphatidylserine/phosphatidylglycerophosphate/cardiolipin synthase-like enzyme